jgi:hypothetical protein
MTSLLRWFAPLVLSVALVPLASLAHPGHQHEPDEPAEPVTEQPAESRFPQGIVLPSVEGPKPWSDKPVLNDPDRFQIAIMTDHNGGHRPGVWMDAVRKLNQLRPEFVMSVGDLIEGYSQDRTQVEAMWREFLGFIDHMEMRFFFVAGNHDVTNPLMHKIWREHFGPEWYSFDYKGVHFLCLSSEDPVEHLSDQQVDWITKDLEANRDARWTLLFFHKPLWVRAERDIARGEPDSTNWKKIEKLLVDRPHTVFAGHVHHYVQYQRNGTQYYTLATTGGGSQLRGNEYGEFDHVMWLTMEKDGPHLVNLRLDGILPANVVTEESARRFNSFLRQTSIEVAPILLDVIEEEGFTDGEIVIRLRNDFNEPIELTGAIEGLPLRGVSVDPLQLKLAVGPGESVEQKVQVRFNELIDFPSLARTSLVATVRTTGENPIQAERIAPVLIDRRFTIPTLAKLPAIDGTIDSWPERTLRFPEQPLLLGNAQSWNGPGDATAEFTGGRAGGRMYVAVKVTDDQVLAGIDGVELIVDGRPVATRKLTPDFGRDGLSIKAILGEEGKEPKVTARWTRNGAEFEGVTAAAKRTEKGYDVEFSIPLRSVRRMQGDDWHSVQMTMVLHDADQADQEPVEVLWRGTRRPYRVNTGFGHFVPER